MESGAQLGFHSFYAPGNQLVELAEGVDAGKTLAMLAVGYAQWLHVDMSLIIDSMKTRPDDILLIDTGGPAADTGY